MPGLVVGRALTLLLAEHDLALRPQQDLLERIREVGELHPLVGTPRRHQRRLVGQVLQVGADHSRRGRREALQVDIVCERHVPGMHLEDGKATGLVGRIDRDPPVEAPRPHQRCVQDLGAVRGGQDDDPFGTAEAVHLRQDLVERLLTLLVPAHDPAAARASDGVEFVDEDDGGRGLFGLFEQVAHAAGAHTHEHLDELRGRQRKERHVRLARHGPGQKRLAGAGRPVQKDPARDPPTELQILLGVCEEIDDLGEFEFDLVDARHILERRALLVGLVALGARFAHPQDATAAACAAGRAPEEVDEQQDQQDRRTEPDQQCLPERPGLVERLGRVQDTFRLETFLQFVVLDVARPHRSEALRALRAVDLLDLVSGVARDAVAERADLFDVAAVDLLQKLRVRDRDAFGLVRRERLEHDPVERERPHQYPPEPPTPRGLDAPSAAAVALGWGPFDAPFGWRALGSAGGCLVVG